jgi:peroxiredoxin
MSWLPKIMGKKATAALGAGTQAPDFELSSIDGKTFSLRDALGRGPVVAAFFKVSCPVCQYAFPFLDRIYKAHGGKKVTFVGISQNDGKDTAEFIKKFGVSFPVLMDDTKSYPVSNAYGLTNVPTIFWIAQDGTIEVSSVGWSRQDVEQINRKAAEANADEMRAVFRPDEKIADFKAG